MAVESDGLGSQHSGCGGTGCNLLQPAGTEDVAGRKWFPKSKCLLDTDSRPSSWQLLVLKS